MTGSLVLSEEGTFSSRSTSLTATNPGSQTRHASPSITQSDPLNLCFRQSTSQSCSYPLTGSTRSQPPSDSFHRPHPDCRLGKSHPQFYASLLNSAGITSHLYQFTSHSRSKSAGKGGLGSEKGQPRDSKKVPRERIELSTSGWQMQSILDR
jgi:hypothetical protein